MVKRSVEYLGYVVTSEGIAADPKKVTAVCDFPELKDLKTLRSFVGLASYYRRFIPSLSKVAAPLFELTKKDTPFHWSASCQVAFKSLKEALTNAPVLAFPRFGDGYLLETDASGVGLGAVLAQKQDDGTTRPIAYASRTLQSHERNYGVTELEALGVVWAVCHFRHYLYGTRCNVFTDHKALKTLLNTPHPSGKLARWGLSLQELDVHIHYRPGPKNTNADALSRCPTGGSSERVFLYVPSAKQGKAHKFARPFRGPYRIINLYDNGADIRPVDRPQQATTRVSLNRLRKCPKEISELADTPPLPSAGNAVDCVADGTGARHSIDGVEVPGIQPTNNGTLRSDASQTTTIGDGVWTGRLRNRQPILDPRGRGP